MKRKELLENWKCGHDSEWQVQVDAVMVNKALMKAKQKSEASLAAETAKRLSMEVQLQTTQATLKEKVSFLENQLAATQSELKCVTESNDQLSRVTSDWQLPQHNKLTRRKNEGFCRLFHVNNSGHERSRYTLIFVNHSHSWRVREYMHHPSHLYTTRRMILKFLI